MKYKKINSHQKSNNYTAADYETKDRFCSYWHQIDEVRKAMPTRDGQILVIGKGSGFIDTYLHKIGYKVDTLDIDTTLNPTYCASVLKIPLKSESIDLVVCCQVLEHLPFDQFSIALREIRRILKSGGKLVLSLPDLTRTYRFSLQLPKLGYFTFIIPVPTPEWIMKQWEYNGEHYWNIGNKYYPVKRIAENIENNSFVIKREFRVFEMSWHRFFIATAK